MKRFRCYFLIVFCISYLCGCNSRDNSAIQDNFTENIKGTILEETGSVASLEEEKESDENKDFVHPVFTPEETYDTSFFGKSAEELYEEVFAVTEQETEFVHFYTEDGILYLDEYEQTENQDDEGVYIYEWNNRKKIAEKVIAVDYNWYRLEPDALYITEDHVLHGTGKYQDITLENIKYASVYADQILALTLDGNLWCRGKLYSISDGRTLEYQGWELILQNVAYAQLGHYRFMAITSDGGLYMWGDNTYGQFGDGTLLKGGAALDTECYFYPEPIKVADNIKMVWEGHPGKPKQTEEIGECRTYFLTEEDRLYVSGEGIGEENRSFTYYGEMGYLEEPMSINCTSTLHAVDLQEY